VPGIGFDRSYGTLLLGAHSKVWDMDANFGASTTFAQEGGDNASVYFTLGSSF